MTEYLERLRDVRGLSKMALRRVEHLYYKNDQVYGAMRKLVQQQQAATAQQTTQTQQEGSDEAVEAEDLDEDETEAKQVIMMLQYMGLLLKRATLQPILQCITLLLTRVTL